MIDNKRLLWGVAALAVLVESVLAFVWQRRKRRLARNLHVDEAIVDAAAEVVEHAEAEAERAAHIANRRAGKRDGLITRWRRRLRARRLRLMEAGRDRSLLRWRRDG